MEPEHDLKINVCFKLLAVNGISEQDSTFSTQFQLVQTWKDKRLAWSTCKWNDIESIKVDPKEVWLPELVLLNSAGDYRVNEARFLEIYHDGTVVYRLVRSHLQ